MDRRSRRVAYFTIAVIAGFFLMEPLGSLFDVMAWPVFSTWAQTHGTSALAWATIAALIFGGLAFFD
jgi:hypothetical protein